MNKYLVVILLVIVIPATGFFTGYFYGEMLSRGWFTKWQSMGNPPGNITKIGLCGFKLCAKTSDQKMYEACHTVGLQYNPPCWKEIEKNTPLAIPAYNPCKMWIDFGIVPPPNTVVQKIETKTCGISAEQTNYVLLKDGSIWFWHHIALDEEPIIWVVLLGYSGFGIGYFVAMILVISVIIHWDTTNQSKRTWAE